MVEQLQLQPQIRTSGVTGRVQEFRGHRQRSGVQGSQVRNSGPQGSQAQIRSSEVTGRDQEFRGRGSQAEIGLLADLPFLVKLPEQMSLE